jgi:phosphatidylserine/phosphatidylglycerophosphate/cardiolipin synthase-like enzyme
MLKRSLEDGQVCFCKKIIITIFCSALSVMGGYFSAIAEARQNHILADQPGCAVILLTNKDYFPALIKVIDDAQDEIFISIFSFKVGVHKNSYPDQVLLHLSQAVRRGVKVKIILENTGNRDQKLDEQSHRTKNTLEEKGVKVYLDSPRRTTHTKLIVIDQKIVLLGSHNLTSAALKYNNEVSILLENPALAKSSRDYMLTIIKEAK